MRPHLNVVDFMIVLIPSGVRARLTASLSPRMYGIEAVVWISCWCACVGGPGFSATRKKIKEALAINKLEKEKVMNQDKRTELSKIWLNLAYRYSYTPC